MPALLQLGPAGMGAYGRKHRGRMRAFRLQTEQRGGTLIEVMTVCALLAVLAIAAVTVLHQTGSGLALEQQRRIALALANSRLEELRSAPYAELTALIALNYSTTALRIVSGQVVPGTGESEIVGGKPMSLVTTLRYADADGGTASYAMLRMTAAVQYRSEGGVVT